MPRRLWVAFLILPATAALYLGYVVWLGVEMGFPLDDAWIHQTFARNLVQLGEFAYNSGQPSTASTSPLWNLMLAAGYLLPGGFRFWAYALGLLFLGLTSWLGYLLCRRLFPEHPRIAALAGVSILLEWRLNWAALSGMETTLFAFSCLLLIYLAVLALEEGLFLSRACLIGTAAGLAAVIRPEGLALAALALGAVAWRQKPLRWAALALGIWFILVLPLVAYNLAVAGTPLPSTFYAKHAAYVQSLSLGFIISYLVGAVGVMAGGPLVVLLPGVVYVAYRVVCQLVRVPSPLALLPRRKRGSERREKGSERKESESEKRVGDLAAFVLIGLWAISLPILYMVGLPPLFHHGRYLMPLVPLLLVVGLGGLAGLAEVMPFRLLPRVYGGLAVLVFLVLWVNGAVVYGWDVKFIDDEQVETAMWLNNNVSAEALVATHDIGAIGYFSGRRIVDTAGLITPELVPYVRDQTKILSYLEARKIDYLAVFPQWYPEIVADSRFEEVFRVEQPYVVAAGADNMTVYRARW